MTSIVGHPVQIHSRPQSDVHRDGKKMEGIREMSREEWDISRSILGCNQLKFLPEWLGLRFNSKCWHRHNGS